MPKDGRSDGENGAPVTLHRVMKDAIGDELRSRYAPAKEMPHALLVLVMQLNDDRRRKQKDAPP